jgi:hypothetical protein
VLFQHTPMLSTSDFLARNQKYESAQRLAHVLGFDECKGNIFFLHLQENTIKIEFMIITGFQVSGK